MFIVRSSLKEKSSTFASFARYILTKLLKITSYRLHLCFDIYESPSIKDNNRKSRGRWEEYEDPIYGQINGEKKSYCSIDN